MKRKILIMERHGIKRKKQGNALTSESIRSLTLKGTGLRGVVSTNPEEAFIRHSDEPRTLRTANALSNGIYLINPSISTNSELDVITGIPTDVAEDSGLSYGPDFKYNKDFLKEIGADAYIEWMLRNPTKTSFKGQDTTSFAEWLAKTNDALKSGLTDINAVGKRLGILASHGGLAEALMANAVNSCRKTPVTNPDDMGGMFQMEDYAVVELDYHERTGLDNARVRRGDQVYDMDVSKILSN